LGTRKDYQNDGEEAKAEKASDEDERFFPVHGMTSLFPKFGPAPFRLISCPPRSFLAVSPYYVRGERKKSKSRSRPKLPCRREADNL